jgi:hypothetical protein
MKSKRSRLAIVGVLALAMTVTVGLVSGSVAEAKKKGAKSVTAVGAPIAIPVAASNNAPAGVANVPLVVGKKAKGKVVGWDSVAITTTFTGSTNTALGSIFSELIAPNGRTVFLNAPVFNTSANPGQGNQVAGPTTETPDSFVNPCFPSTAPSQPCPGGSGRDPDALLGPPYAGTIQNGALSHFGGVPARGTWTLRLFNTSTTTTATLNAASLFITLRKSPPA